MRSIYLDYNATTPVAPSVQEALTPFLTEHWGNPSSNNALGRAAREAIEDARIKVAALLGADRDEIVFTSGGTESNNLALQGLMMRDAPSLGGHLIISAIEHASVVEPARFLERLGYELTVIGCDSQGQVAPARVESAIRDDTQLVSIIHANHETGVLQPLREIADICHAHNVRLHTDAVQSVGKVGTFVDELGVDLLSFAGHKCYAPKGCGVLYVRRGVRLDPILHGEGHEGGLRSGVENVPYIVALGQAARLALRSLEEPSQRLGMLRDRLHDRLHQVIGEHMTVNSARAPRLSNTLSINFHGLSGPQLLSRIPEVCAATGAVCHNAPTGMSPTLAAMGVDPEDARGTVRFSVGWYTSEEDIDRAVELILGAWEGLR